MNQNIIFYSNNNYVLGEKLRNCLRKFNLDVMYCNNLKNLIIKIANQKNNVIFMDKEFRKYAHFVSELIATDLTVVENVRFIFIDDDLEYYVNFINNVRLFNIPERNLETVLYNVITKCKMLNYAQDSMEFSHNNYGEIISDELRKLGFSYKLVGFRYIKQCMEQAIKNNFILGALQKDVYPYVGLQNSTSATNIERGIRTAILNASKQDCFKLDDINGDHKLVSNRFFLEYLLDKLRIYKCRQIS